MLNVDGVPGVLALPLYEWTGETPVAPSYDLPA